MKGIIDGALKNWLVARGNDRTDPWVDAHPPPTLRDMPVDACDDDVSAGMAAAFRYFSAEKKPIPATVTGVERDDEGVILSVTVRVEAAAEHLPTYVAQPSVRTSVWAVDEAGDVVCRAVLLVSLNQIVLRPSWSGSGVVDGFWCLSLGSRGNDE